jgi:hypothetical protein
MQRPRFRFTIRRLMILVVLASLVLTLVVVQRNRRRRLVALQNALAVYQNAKLTRETAEIAVVEYTQGIYLGGNSRVLFGRRSVLSPPMRCE